MLSARQVFGGPVWTVVGGFTSTLANAAFNEVRASFLSNKPPIICNQAGAGGSALLALGPPGTFARRNYPGATFGCGFTGLEAEEDLSISDTFSFLLGRHQMKVGAAAARCLGGSPAPESSAEAASRPPRLSIGRRYQHGRYQAARKNEVHDVAAC